MGPETVNRLKDSEIHGDFVGRDKITNIIMFQESDPESSPIVLSILSTNSSSFPSAARYSSSFQAAS